MSEFRGDYRGAIMSSLSRLGIGLSVVFGCFFLALVAELYYVFWWRKRLNSSGGESVLNGEVEDEYSSPSRELFYLLCWKRPASASLSARALNQSQREANANNSNGNGQVMDDRHGVLGSPDQSSMRPDFVAKFFPVQAEAEGMDGEIMRLHSLLGPPRILFTIKEETKEDLDSEDGRSRAGKSKRGSRSRSLSDLLAQIGSGTVTPIDTPYVTPPSSPPFCTPFTTPPHQNITTRFSSPLIVHNGIPKQHLNPLSEESGCGFSSLSSSASLSSSSLPSSFPSSFASSASHSPLISPPPHGTTLHVFAKQQSPAITQGGHFSNVPTVSSPPPKFKFLRDADEKVSSHNTTAMDLCKQQECHSEQAIPSSPSSSSAISSDEDGSFITIIVGDSCFSSSSSHQAPHSSPVSGSNPVPQVMPLSTSALRSPLFSPATGSTPRKSSTDTTEKQCS